MTNNLMEEAGTELGSLSGSGLMFHGTAKRFDAVKASPSKRFGDGRIDWQGTAIFAAIDSRVALHYTANRGTGFFTGIDLRSLTDADRPIVFGISGGASLKEAMTKLYGDPARPETCRGYIYLLDKSKFLHEPGLGIMELITRDPSANIGRLTINRRAAIDELVRDGSVLLDWIPRLEAGGEPADFAV
ncbi:MAG: hypothetical protein WC423_24110 [Vulcanimicrobiota bacterium]